MPGNWGSENFAGTFGDSDLQSVINEFPVGLKQAMFAAASRTTIKRKTWNNCAMNAAGFEVGKQGSVQSLRAASETFGIPESLVSRFIQKWDKLQGTDEDCTIKLREMIERSGLFNEPEVPGKKPTRIVSVTVYKQLREELDILIEQNEVPDEDMAVSILDGSLAGV